MSEAFARNRAVISLALRNRALRRVEIAYGLFVGAEWAVWVAFLVYGYTHGGASAGMTIALVQVVPTAVLSPLLGMLTGRYGSGRVLFAGYVALTAFLIAACAQIALGAPRWSVFVTAMFVSIAITLGRPAQAALVPAIVRTPEELTASNVLAGWSESAWKLIAPALGGALMALHGPALAIAGTALMSFVGALLVAPTYKIGKNLASDDYSSEFRASISVVARDPALRLLLGIQGSYQVIAGATDFLMVILALSILHIGQGGAGYMTAMLGAGGLLAGFATFGLIGRTKLGGTIIVSLLCVNLLLASLGFNQIVLLAFVLLGAVGFAGGLFDVTGRTLLQRAAPPESLASAFSILESLMDTGLALGVVIVRAAFAAGGDRGAFWIPGLAGAFVVLAASRRLLAVDHAAPVPHVQIELLRSVPIFSCLKGPVLEGVAHQLVPVRAGPGEVVIRQGDPGDRYYLIADGTLEVSRDGIEVATIGRGQGFGEIALIRESPRTASVTAKNNVLLYALDKEPFVLVLTGHAAAHERAKTTVTGHLRSLGLDEETGRRPPPGPEG
ncbi:MAG: MFS transporter [Acidimicrobiales bacterium]